MPMTTFLEVRFSEAIDALTNKTHKTPTTLHSLTDFTLLDLAATEADIVSRANLGMIHEVASLCVYTQHLAYIPSTYTRPITTVINFPSGNYTDEDVIKEIACYLHSDTVDEVDYVFPYQRYLQGETTAAIDSCRVISDLCRENGWLFKVILETGAFPDIQSVYTASTELIKADCCDFLKTSTGKIPLGVNRASAFAILAAILDNDAACGIKLSGGIKTLAQAEVLVTLAEHVLEKKVSPNWFRLGSSQLFHY